MSLERQCGDQELISSLQNELDLYKQQHILLRKQIDQVVLLDDKRLDGLTLAEIDSNFQKYKQISGDAIRTLKEQLENVIEERTIYQQLWQTSQQTIINLEKEINQYLNQANSPEITLQKQIRASEQQMCGLRHDLEVEKSANMSLEKSKSLCEAQMQALDKKYNDLIVEHRDVLGQLKHMESAIHESRTEMADLKRERDDCKRKLAGLGDELKRCQARERIAYAKLNDAIQVVETAITEKNTALQREKELRDECDQFAMTIGRAMEEASEKVDGNIGEIRLDYARKLKKLEDIIKKLIESKETMAKNNHMSKQQIHEIQTNLVLVTDTNKTLDRDLQTASKTIVELEMKLKAYERLIACEQVTAKETEERSAQFQELLDKNLTLKQKWRAMFTETTDKFQTEIAHLKMENTVLLNENQKLKIRCKQKA